MSCLSTSKYCLRNSWVLLQYPYGSFKIWTNCMLSWNNKFVMAGRKKTIKHHFILARSHLWHYEFFMWQLRLRWYKRAVASQRPINYETCWSLLEASTCLPCLSILQKWTGLGLSLTRKHSINGPPTQIIAFCTSAARGSKKACHSLFWH